MIKKIYKYIVQFVLLIISPMMAHAHDSVRYHCPTIQQVSDVFTIKSILNGIDVEWALKSNVNRADDRPVHFTKATLILKEQDSYDMEVLCEYKTQMNKKFIIAPIPNWNLHVDGIIKEKIGNNWYLSDKAEYVCTKSIIDCPFILS